MPSREFRELPDSLNGFTDDLPESLEQGNDNVRIIMTGRELNELVKELVRRNSTEWLTAEQVAARFQLPYNNVKDARWRKKMNFPTHQPEGKYSKPLFEFNEVSDWLRQN